MAVTQDTHRISISTPLGKDVLLLRGFSGSESMSQMFRFDLELLSEKDSIKFQDVVGKSVTVHVNTAEGDKRHFNGFLSGFSQGPQERRLTAYQAQMVPWLWFLTRTADCRIFQNQKVPDIIQKIFTDLKFHDFELRLKGSYTPRDYCVQYRETDFNFVSRLMEEEGISYFFDHTDGKHVMVLADDPSANKPCPGQPTARYNFYGPGANYQEDLVTEWHYYEEFRPGAWAQTDYNFEMPSTSLAVTVNGKNPYEIYEYPGEHNVRALGDRLAKIRLQEQSVPCVVSRGSSMCRNFASGFQFTLQEHYRSDLNQKYLITAVRHVANSGGNYEVGAAGGDGMTYQNSFECIPASTTFRPPRVTPTPFVQGCQTAVVVGPGGEEIYTDKYGRVKVQFHWDREGKQNENSSCWIRVSQPWAGQGWGAVAIPRIGQEVIVDFLEGDPDQPIITGRVYNAEQMPPFALPGKAVISGVKSNSTKGGGGNNEISLDDTKGTELINIHAQFDQQKKIEHDERVNVGHDRTEQVGNNETITIGNNETITIGNDRTEEVKHNESIKIDNDKSELVLHNRSLDVGNDKNETVRHNKSVHVMGSHGEGIGGSMTISVAMALTEVVGLNYSETVGAAMELTVAGVFAESVGINKAQTIGKDSSETVGQNKTLEIAKDLTEKVGQNHSLTVQKDLTETINGQHQETVEKDYILQAKKIQIVAQEEVNIQTGSAQITMKKNGDITVEGKTITIKGSGDVVIKASNIKEN